MGVLSLFLETLMPFSLCRFFSSRRDRRRQTWSFVHADDTKLPAHRQADSAPEVDDVLGAAVNALEPVTRSFGGDVADFIDVCISAQALTFDAPITGIRIEPTVLGESRDGGFLVLVTVGHVTTVASGRLGADLFRDADDIAAHVLAAVMSTANSIYRSLLSTADELTRSRS
ncbi:hypothetical protein [Actinoplanes philippinensis]|uniref:hypothetical protein n=1 Tax=Actinoplanes philippinensis TaxID=35752 RepID=UPI0034085608